MQDYQNEETVENQDGLIANTSIDLSGFLCCILLREILPRAGSLIIAYKFSGLN